MNIKPKIRHRRKNIFLLIDVAEERETCWVSHMAWNYLCLLFYICDAYHISHFDKRQIFFVTRTIFNVTQSNFMRCWMWNFSFQTLKSHRNFAQRAFSPQIFFIFFFLFASLQVKFSQWMNYFLCRSLEIFHSLNFYTGK